jgi:hypothetical protein
MTKGEIVRVMTSTELKFLKTNKNESLIPDNPYYCYKSCKQSKEVPKVFPITELCSYWRVASDKSETLSGYCLFLEKGDWEEGGTTALFDQLKCCGINDKRKDIQYPKGSIDSLMLEHDQMQRSILDKTPSNIRWRLPQDNIVSKYQETQLDKQFGRSKKVYRRLMKLSNY